MAAFDGNLACGQRGDHARIKPVLGFLDARMQFLGRIAGEYGDSFLRDDRAGVDALIHKMHRTTSELHAVIQRLFPRFQAGKGGQQGGVNVDDTAGERAQKLPLQDAHETGKHDQIDAAAGQKLHETGLGGFIQLGAEFARIDEFTANAALASLLQDA